MIASFHDAQLDGETFDNKYTKEEFLGSGMHSNVHKCYLISDTEQLNPFAVKITTYDSDEKRGLLIQEFHLGQKLKHSSIPRFYSYYDTEFKEEIYIIMDYIEGEELSDIMKIDDADSDFVLGKERIVNYSF